MPSKPISDFQSKVYAHLLVIPAGQVTSYGILAKALASSSSCSARAVGGALRSNPWAPEVPCHRVIASNGYVGGFNGDWENLPKSSSSSDTSSSRLGINQSRKLSLLKDEGVYFDTKGKLIVTRPDIWFDGPWDITESSKEIARRKLCHGL